MRTLTIIFLMMFTNIIVGQSVEVEFLNGYTWYTNSAGLLLFENKYKNLDDTKTIKYLKVEINAYNEVGDLMTPEIGGRYGRITGPIKPNDSKRIFNDFGTYYRGKVETIKLRVMEVEYMDGSTNTTPTQLVEHPNPEHKFQMEGQKFLNAFAIVGLLALTIFAFGG